MWYDPIVKALCDTFKFLCDLAEKIVHQAIEEIKRVGEVVTFELVMMISKALAEGYVKTKVA